MHRRHGDVYVQGIRLNGHRWPLTYVRHADVVAGGMLEFDMGPEPDPLWGRDPASRPPSDSDDEALVRARAVLEAQAHAAQKGRE